MPSRAISVLGNRYAICYPFIDQIPLSTFRLLPPLLFDTHRCRSHRVHSQSHSCKYCFLRQSVCSANSILFAILPLFKFLCQNFGVFHPDRLTLIDVDAIMYISSLIFECLASSSRSDSWLLLIYCIARTLRAVSILSLSSPGLSLSSLCCRLRPSIPFSLLAFIAI